MMDVIRVLKNQETFAIAEAKKQGREYKGYHGLFASHPDNDTRLKEVLSQATIYQQHNGEDKRQAYLDSINGMTFGDSEQQGIRSENNFYHLPMQFAVTFPVNWQIKNNPDSVQAISPRGEAYIEMTATDLNRRLSPKDFIKQRLKITKLKSGRSLSANGLSGYSGIIEQQGKTGRISVIFLKQQVFIFFATTKDVNTFAKYDIHFLSTAKGFHALRQDEVKLAKAKRIDVVKVGRKDSYPKWAKHSRISNSPLQQLQLLNADYPNGQLKPGQLAKRVK
jgi:predicted Zn-dependent protease